MAELGPLARVGLRRPLRIPAGNSPTAQDLGSYYGRSGLPGSEDYPAAQYPRARGLVWPELNKTPPVIGNESPAAWSTIVHSQAVSIDVTDDSGVPALVVIYASSSGKPTELVLSGADYFGLYSGTVTPIANGNRYLFSRNGGWPTDEVTIYFRALDSFGNSTTGEASYVVSNPTDAAGPYFANETPTVGSTITHGTPIAFDVLDDSGSLAAVSSYVSFDGGTSWELANEGAYFPLVYAGGSSQVLITGGRRITLQRDGGWLAGVSIRVEATDNSGNVTVGLLSYVCSDPIAPQVSNQTPAPGETIYPGSTISFDVTSERPLVVLEVQADQASREVIHDGSGFVPPYETSVRIPVTNGYRYQIRRSGGWRAAPTFRVRVLDSEGQG